MEVRRLVIAVENRDDDAQKTADFRHLTILPLTPDFLSSA
jgi:hypothetical protein